MSDAVALRTAAIVGVWRVAEALRTQRSMGREDALARSRDPAWLVRVLPTLDLEEVAMGNPVVHWEIGGRDLDSMAGFYRELFGWEAASYDADYRLVTPDGGIGGGLMRCQEGMPSYVTVYVAVDDLDATLAKVVELGGAPLVPPTPIPGIGSFALFEDPEGNTIGILRPEA